MTKFGSRCHHGGLSMDQNHISVIKFPYCTTTSCHVNTLRPRQNGRRFADDTFKRIFLNENVRILIKISLKFVPKGPINIYPALVQIMGWRRSDDKPLSEPMMVSLPTHICVTRPQSVKKRIRQQYRNLSYEIHCETVASLLANGSTVFKEQHVTVSQKRLVTIPCDINNTGSRKSHCEY